MEQIQAWTASSFQELGLYLKLPQRGPSIAGVRIFWTQEAKTDIMCVVQHIKHQNFWQLKENVKPQK